MLLLPLHRPLMRATFPVVTALLVVVNVFVYFGWQSGDNARIAEVVEDYAHSRLGEIEAPAYERWLIDRGGRGDAVEEYRDAEDDEARRALVATNALFDPEFVPAMETGRWFPDGATFAEWRTLRPAYDETLGDIFTLRHLLRASEVSPARMVTSAFLHGDAMHLFGNMVFLVVIGLLVEGALGPWRFGVVYLLGAIGASAASLVFHWGDAAGGLGASGAIAALMGCFCLVWGLQPVRFFYWIGVWFDYVRAPAVWLFPAWLGWEVFNLVSRDASSNVAFEAHAGGLVCGAAMGWMLSAMGQVRHEFIREDASNDAAPAGDDRWERAQRHMGRMQLSEADQLLDQLATQAPWRVDVQVARYRVAYNGARAEQANTRAVQALSIDAHDAQAVRLQADLFVELARRNATVPPTVRLALARRCINFDLLDDAERALQDIPADVAPDVQSQLWFELALRHRDAGAQAAHVRCLRHLSERHPMQPQAVKARFLLENA
ncbi:rhomboid family intramembrane serine protease [Lysobacter sp. A6]|uniref:Rhomboid family intramembrane serine protease n=1 Tax=Noviluteimonas lactosilytica TaxID=2888523 RepID=A0ABS8JIU3_9GAMM|nr:rhomboid family intramembrane serine protease [Lysobacter lactosilyticus]MCC8363526.1 rhomboid family intramembrane serine protease [Lysobacter lactosilyticus]